METRFEGHASQTSKSILLLAGSFSFAFLLGEMIHEFGHYLSHLAYNSPGVQVHLDPFGGSRIMGVTSLRQDVMGITSAAGPLFNLILSVIFLLLLWRERKPTPLPLMLWGPVAMVQEGVTFSLGLLTPSGDAQWVAAMGIPKVVLLGAGILILMAGIVLVTLLLPIVGIKQRDSFSRKASIVIVGMCSLMLIRSVYAIQTSPEAANENLFPLFFSILLAFFVVLLHEPLSNFVESMQISPDNPVTWLAVALAVTMGISMFVFQIVALN